MIDISKVTPVAIPPFATATVGEFCVAVYKANAERGWWDEDRDLLQLCVLVNTEFAEAVEGDRKNLMDDHLPQFRMRNVELADAIIRMADIFGAIACGRYPGRFPVPVEMVGSNWLSDPIAVYTASKYIRNFLQETNRIMRRVCEAGCDFEPRGTVNANMGYVRLRRAFEYTIRLYSSMSDNFGAEVDAKLAYNAQRADHSREARAAQNGKKY